MGLLTVVGKKVDKLPVAIINTIKALKANAAKMVVA